MGGGGNGDMNGAAASNYCNLTLSSYGTEAGLFTIATTVFFLLAMYVLQGGIRMKEIQQASLRKRLEYCGLMNFYICLVSFFFNLGHVLAYLVHLDHSAMLKLVFLEYMLTCPVMQANLAILGGPSVQERHRGEVAALTLLVLSFGFAASMIDSIVLKMACFVLGASAFVVLVKVNNSMVLQHSGGRESIFGGNLHARPSPYKKIAKKIVMTWVLFPLWWLISPEGLGVLQNHEVNSTVQVFLSIVAKGLYVIMIRLITDKYANKESLMDDDHPAGKNKELAGEEHPKSSPSFGHGGLPIPAEDCVRRSSNKIDGTSTGGTIGEEDLEAGGGGNGTDAFQRQFSGPAESLKSEQAIAQMIQREHNPSSSNSNGGDGGSTGYGPDDEPLSFERVHSLPSPRSERGSSGEARSVKPNNNSQARELEKTQQILAAVLAQQEAQKEAHQNLLKQISEKLDQGDNNGATPCRPEPVASPAVVVPPPAGARGAPAQDGRGFLACCTSGGSGMANSQNNSTEPYTAYIMEEGSAPN